MPRWPWSNRPKCIRLVKYHDWTLEISGVQFGELQIGKLTTESKLVQKAASSLALLDGYLYHRCVTISNISDVRIRDQEFIALSREQAGFRRIVLALMALSNDPDSPLLQEALSKLLVDSVPKPDELKLLSAIPPSQELFEDGIKEIRVKGASIIPEPSKTKAAGSPPHIETARNEYTTGDEVVLKGRVPNGGLDLPALIQIFGPSGRSVRLDPIKPRAGGSFDYRLPSRTLRDISGIYIARLTHGGNVATTEFRFTVDTDRIQEWRSTTAKVNSSKHQLRYLISGAAIESVSADPGTAILTIKISSETAGKLTLAVHRMLFDSKSDRDSDLDFVVFVDGLETFSQDLRSGDRRILEIVFEKESKEIVIVGTRMTGKT